MDSDLEFERRHGLDIPVLLLDGVKACQHRLDRAELLAAAAATTRRVETTIGIRQEPDEPTY